MGACEPDHPVRDLVNIDSPGFGSSDLVLANPSRTRLHIARLCLEEEGHRFFLDSLAFGSWVREALGVSTRLFRTSGTFVLYLFAPGFPESAQALRAPVSGLFQVELIPYAVLRVEGRPDPVIHLMRPPRNSQQAVQAPKPAPPGGPSETVCPEEIPAGLTPEEVAEFARLEKLYFAR